MTLIKRLSTYLSIGLIVIVLSACGGDGGGSGGTGGTGGDGDGDGSGGGEPGDSVECVWGESEWDNCDWAE